MPLWNIFLKTYSESKTIEFFSKMNPLLNDLQTSLLEDASGANQLQWAKYIVQNDIALEGLASLIHAEKTIATRFSWMLGGIVQIDPQRVFPILPYLFHHRQEIGILNFERSLAKMFSLAGIPEEIEGEAVEALFQWLMDPKAILSTRVFAMEALHKVCKRHWELQHELKLVLETLIPQSEGSLEKKARKLYAILP
jgi:hypothetical protein